MPRQAPTEPQDGRNAAPAMIGRPWVVYALLEPADGEIRYVGWTINLQTRIRDHLKPSRLAGGTRRDRWLRKLVAAGARPEVVTLESGSGDWQEAEQRWISHYRAAGADLTNLTDGGEGTPGRLHTDDAKRRMSEKRKGRKPSQAAIDASVRRAKETKNPAAVAAMNAARRGSKATAETRAKISVARTGTKASPESRAKMSLAHVGRASRPCSEETKVKLRAAMKGRPVNGILAYWAALSPEERSQKALERYRAKRG